MQMITDNDKDKRAVKFFQNILGDDFWVKYKDQFEIWLNGRKPYPGNFARFMNLRIPEEILNQPADQRPNPARTWLDRQKF
jgi:hypothetical protein